MTATRRRGATLVDAILQAVRAEVAEHGYGGTTYDGVAGRAGTSKPVLYRRWPTKAQMVLEALVRAHPHPTVPADSGSLAGDLKAFLRLMRAAIERYGRRNVLSLMAELDRTSGEAVRELLFTRGAELLEPALDRARRRGELGDATLPARIVSLPLDLVRHEVTIMGALTEETLDTIVDDITVPLFVAHSRPPRR